MVDGIWFRRLLKVFALDLMASHAARPTGIGVDTFNTIYLKTQLRIRSTEKPGCLITAEARIFRFGLGSERIRGKHRQLNSGILLMSSFVRRHGCL